MWIPFFGRENKRQPPVSLSSSTRTQYERKNFFSTTQNKNKLKKIQFGFVYQMYTYKMHTSVAISIAIIMFVVSLIVLGQKRIVNVFLLLLLRQSQTNFLEWKWKTKHGKLLKGFSFEFMCVSVCASAFIINLSKLFREKKRKKWHCHRQQID